MQSQRMYVCMDDRNVRMGRYVCTCIHACMHVIYMSESIFEEIFVCTSMYVMYITELKKSRFACVYMGALLILWGGGWREEFAAGFGE